MHCCWPPRAAWRLLGPKTLLRLRLKLPLLKRRLRLLPLHIRKSTRLPRPPRLQKRQLNLPLLRLLRLKLLLPLLQKLHQQPLKQLLLLHRPQLLLLTPLPLRRLPTHLLLSRTAATRALTAIRATPPG
jgi:hypothetical protein